MHKNKFGFTLVELLAVVLIIATLTAIALPQYRRSVSRAEAMEAMVSLRTLYDSAVRYRSVRGEPPDSLQGLDVSFFDATSDTSNTFIMGKFQYNFDGEGIYACRLNGNYCFSIYYIRSFHYRVGENEFDRTNSKGDLFCKFTDGGRYDWLCEALGTGYVGDNEWLIDR